MSMLAQVLSDFYLSSEILHLNNGSFGVCPRSIHAHQLRIAQEIEEDPDKFFFLHAEDRLRESQQELSSLLNVSANDLVWVRNATMGVNAVLRSIPLSKGNVVVITNHIYNACRNVVDYVTELTGATCRVVKIPFPCTSEQQVAELILSAVCSSTKLVFLDHITSATGMVFPLKLIIPELRARGIDSFVDGAHAPGQIQIDISAVRPTYYVGNCHKWLFAPKGVGFLYVAPERQELIHPVVISHGSNAESKTISKFQRRFKWPGTDDLSGFLSIQKALEYPRLHGYAGYDALIERNHKLVAEARDLICRELNLTVPCPESMIGAMAAIPLNQSIERFISKLKKPEHIPENMRYQQHLFEEARWRFWYYLYLKHKISVVVNVLPDSKTHYLRVSAQIYNQPEDYQQIAGVLREISEQ